MRRIAQGILYALACTKLRVVFSRSRMLVRLCTELGKYAWPDFKKGLRGYLAYLEADDGAIEDEFKRVHKDDLALIAYIDGDNHARFKWFSGQWLKLLGYDPNELNHHKATEQAILNPLEPSGTHTRNLINKSFTCGTLWCVDKDKKDIVLEFEAWRPEIHNIYCVARNATSKAKLKTYLENYSTDSIFAPLLLFLKAPLDIFENELVFIFI